MPEQQLNDLRAAQQIKGPPRNNSIREIAGTRLSDATGSEALGEELGEGSCGFTENPKSSEELKGDEPYRAAFDLAARGLRSLIAGKGYVDDAGNSLTGKVERRPSKPSAGDGRTLPDGDQYRQSQLVEQ